MSLENNIATLVQKSEQLTSTVDNKVAEIDASTASMLQRVDNALSDNHVIGEGIRGTRGFAIANYFTSTSGVTNMHVKLPYKIDTHNHMFHIHIKGYAYGENAIVDAVFTGYCYKNGNRLHQSKTMGTHEPIVYVGSDQHIYLRLSFTNQYYLTLSADSIRVGNGTVLGAGDIEFINNIATEL